MKTCKTCKWWKFDKSDRYDPWMFLSPPWEFSHCVRAIPLWDASKYAEIDNAYARVLTEEHKDRKFFAQDGSDYIANVITREDFGCQEHST